VKRTKTGRQFIEELDRIQNQGGPTSEKQLVLANEVSRMVEAYRRRSFTTFENVELTPMPSLPYGGICRVCKGRALPGERGYLWFHSNGRTYTYCADCGDEISPQFGQQAFYSDDPFPKE